MFKSIELSIPNQIALWYNILMLLKSQIGRVIVAGSAFTVAVPVAFADVCLMQPIGSVRCIPSGGPLGTLFSYFNLLYPWIAGLAAGAAVLMVLVGGLQVIMSGGDSGKRGEGISRILWAIGGLLLLAFTSLIFRILNPSFYV